jgi:hypothetical protein
LNRERNNDPLQDSQGTQDTLQAVFNSAPRATTIRAVSFASDAAPGSTSVFNRGQLFGPVIGPDTGSGGNSPIQPPEDNSGDKANKRRNEPSREGEQAVPAEQKSSAASNQPEPNLPQTAKTTPEAHDQVVQALTEEAASFLRSAPEPSTEAEMAPPDAPVTRVEPKEPVAVEKTGNVAAR